MSVGRLIDITGKRFGRWTALAVHPERYRCGKDRVEVLWLCRCDCGAEGLVRATSLRRGRSKSCGCIRREMLIKRNTKHGHARRGKVTRVYRCWQNMKTRCYNPHCDKYEYYGARGIGIYQDWRPDFQNFYADVLDPPPGLSLDRVDNDGNYEPSNWRWADQSTQLANRRPYRKRKSR